MTFAPINSIASFPPENIYFSKDPTQFLLQITKVYADLSRAINDREISIYTLDEILTGEQWFTTPNNPAFLRSTYRKVFNFGTIAAGATSTLAHGITPFPGVTFTHIYGTAITDVVDYRPIPYSSATLVTNQIELKVDSTNITIINGATAPGITSAIVVLEYLKN